MQRHGPPETHVSTNRSNDGSFDRPAPRSSHRNSKGRFSFGSMSVERRVVLVSSDAFSSFSVSECCKYSAFLTLFTLLMIASRGDGVNNYYVSEGIRNIMETTSFSKTQISAAPADLEHITQLNDIYDYIKVIVIPSLMNDKYANGTSITSQHDYNMLGGHNKVLGGFRVRQIRGKQKECEHSNTAQYLCYANIVDHDENIDTSTFNDKYEYCSAASLDEAEGYHGILGKYSGGGHVVDFPNNKTQSLALLSQVQQTDHFFDQATRAVFIDFNTYNPVLNLHTVTRVAFEIPAMGGVIPRSEIKTWRFNRYAGNAGIYLMVLEILFYLSVLGFTLEEFRELKSEGLQDYIEDRWNILDWINLFVFYITIGWRIQQYMLIDNDYLYDVNTFHSFRNIQWFFQWENYIQLINGFILWIKLFKYMTFSNRVRFLFTMFRRSSQDLLIFMIVLFVFFLAFGMAAFLSFSSDVSDYRSFTMSIMNLMRYTVTGMDHEALSDSNRFLGNMFYVIWSLLIVLILANVFIAILSESYSAIATEEDEVNVFERLSERFKESMYTVARKTRKFAMLNKVFAGFDQYDTDKDGALSVPEIANAMGIKQATASRLVKTLDKDGDMKLSEQEVNALRNKDMENSEDEDTKEMEEKLDNIERVVRQLTRNARVLRSDSFAAIEPPAQ